MLYITTRDKADSYTAYRALHDGLPADGGQFLPIRIPRYTPEQLVTMQEQGFHETVARVLNMLFPVQLTGWDIEFAIGRKPVRLVDIGKKITIAEFWRNTEGDYSIALGRIYARLCDDFGSRQMPMGWGAIAIRIAFLFGIYSDLCKQGITAFDASASGKDMDQVMSLWYAREMGLPVGRIICGTNENRWIWDLVHKGEISFTTAVQTNTPDLDTLPTGIERLIYGTLGPDETTRYISCMFDKTSYTISEQQLQTLNDGLFSSVIGQQRVADIITGMYRTDRYLVDPYTAISYGALQDYRAKTGENRHTIVFSEGNPAFFSSLICQATGLSKEDIKKK